MYINNINILYYLFLGIIGLGIGQFVAWSTVRLPDYKKVFVREFFTIYLKMKSLNTYTWWRWRYCMLEFCICMDFK